jgi:hypothetical protein
MINTSAQEFYRRFHLYTIFAESELKYIDLRKKILDQNDDLTANTDELVSADSLWESVVGQTQYIRLLLVKNLSYEP